MNKKIIVLLSVLVVIGAANLFAQEQQPPLESCGWGWADGKTIKGKTFYSFAEACKETDGWAYIEGSGSIHYWLYDTYTYNDGDEDLMGGDIDQFKFIDIYIPAWVESMGYVVDYDNYTFTFPNENLASSVITLMMRRNSDISVALIDADTNKPYVVINSWDKAGDAFATCVYPLIPQTPTNKKQKSSSVKVEQTENKSAENINAYVFKLSSEVRNKENLLDKKSLEKLREWEKYINDTILYPEIRKYISDEIDGAIKGANSSKTLKYLLEAVGHGTIAKYYSEVPKDFKIAG